MLLPRHPVFPAMVAALFILSDTYRYNNESEKMCTWLKTTVAAREKTTTTDVTKRRKIDGCGDANGVRTAEIRAHMPRVSACYWTWQRLHFKKTRPSELPCLGLVDARRVWVHHANALPSATLRCVHWSASLLIHDEVEEVYSISTDAPITEPSYTNEKSGPWVPEKGQVRHLLPLV